MMSTGVTSARNRSPFTPTQWQELEQQALVFKYMVTGTPIPPDLIFSIKRSLDTSVTSRLFPHHPIGWGCFEMGFGRKVDPEPGRCRRTDGKKWRCSKEAYPDSKYCERHMHRGRNRSRKPVEQQQQLVSSSSTTTNNTPINTNNTSQQTPYNNNRNLSTITSPSSFPFSSIACDSSQQTFSQSYQNPFFYSQSTSSTPQDATTHQLFLDSSGSNSHDEKDYRTFFPEASSGTSRSYADSYQQLSVNSYKSYSSSPFHNINDNQTRQQEQQQQQHCFVLGTDFKSTRPSNNKDKESETTQKPLHHFFGEWTPKNTDSWLDLASNSRIQTDE